MLAHPTLDQLHTLGLHGLAKGFRELEHKPEARGLDHAEWLGLLLEYELTLRRQKQFETRARAAKLRHSASVEDVNYQTPRGLDRALFLKLSACDWIAERRNLLVTGASGLGKSWLACALGHKACRENISVLYTRVPRLLADLAIAHGDARYARLLRSLARVKLLILDDWGPEALTSSQARDMLEIVEDRYDNGSLIITSQVPIDRWHDLIGVPINAECPHCRWTGVRSADYLSAPWAFWPSASDRGAEIRTRPKVRHGAVARWPQTIDSTIDHESGGGTFYAG
jgi:DNA replication protein DnaC